MADSSDSDEPVVVDDGQEEKKDIIDPLVSLHSKALDIRQKLVDKANRLMRKRCELLPSNLDLQKNNVKSLIAEVSNLRDGLIDYCKYLMTDPDPRAWTIIKEAIEGADRALAPWKHLFDKRPMALDFLYRLRNIDDGDAPPSPDEANLNIGSVPQQQSMAERPSPLANSHNRETVDSFKISSSNGQASDLTVKQIIEEYEQSRRVVKTPRSIIPPQTESNPSNANDKQSKHKNRRVVKTPRSIIPPQTESNPSNANDEQSKPKNRRVVQTPRSITPPQTESYPSNASGGQSMLKNDSRVDDTLRSITPPQTESNPSNASGGQSMPKKRRVDDTLRSITPPQTESNPSNASGGQSMPNKRRVDDTLRSITPPQTESNPSNASGGQSMPKKRRVDDTLPSLPNIAQLGPVSVCGNQLFNPVSGIHLSLSMGLLPPQTESHRSNATDEQPQPKHRRVDNTALSTPNNAERGAVGDGVRGNQLSNLVSGIRLTLSAYTSNAAGETLTVEIPFREQNSAPDNE